MRAFSYLFVDMAMRSATRRTRPALRERLAHWTPRPWRRESWSLWRPFGPRAA